MRKRIDRTWRFLARGTERMAMSLTDRGLCVREAGFEWGVDLAFSFGKVKWTCQVYSVQEHDLSWGRKLGSLWHFSM